MRYHVLMVITVTYGVWSSSTIANEMMRAGAWETTMVVTARNPQTGKEVKVGESNSTMCLTKEFLQTDPYLSASMNEEKMRKKGLKCSVAEYRRELSSANWTLSCVTADGNSVTSDYHVRVSEGHTKTDIIQAVKQGKQTVHTNTLIESSYTGQCNDSMPRL